ncbi:unnamed protein product, partial [Fusarium graminearum]
MIVAGLAPAILGDLTDKVGRRIVYIFMMTIYCTANIGLALQSNWSALFVLRMAQSVGSAATIALGYGVVSDIAPPSERGSFVAIMVLGHVIDHADLWNLLWLQLGLIYLSSGIGSCIGAYGAARKHDITINARAGDDIDNFPIEEARFRSIWYLISVGAVSLIGYGWAIHFQANMAVPLVLHFLIGCSTAIIFNMCGTLLVDVHPKSPSSAQAANSIVRAFLAGGSTGLVQVFIDAMGVGWTFALFGV